jgi:hypothetical protein
MHQPQSERPASASRPARRSLIEFALPASGAPKEMPSAARPLPTAQPASAMRLDKQPFKASDKRMEKIGHEPLDEDQEIVAMQHANCESADKATPAAAKVANEYRANGYELVIANINTTLEYAQRLLSVKTSTEFFELSTMQAGKQMEFIIKQTAALGSIAQRLAASNVRRMSAVKWM